MTFWIRYRPGYPRPSYQDGWRHATPEDITDEMVEEATIRYLNLTAAKVMPGDAMRKALAAVFNTKERP